jgi:hypothetical protein
VRFEATIHARRNVKREDWANYIDVDRIPDTKGRVKALLSTDDCIRLLDEGFEIRLFRAHPIEPLKRDLIVSDKAFDKWLKDQLRDVRKRPMPTPLIDITEK